jgi:hypothetical protein
MIGLVAGILAGIVASEVIGIVGYLAFDRLVGIRFLPVYLGILCAAAAPLVDRRIRGKQRRS